jgi:hypothetical protein
MNCQFGIGENLVALEVICLPFGLLSVDEILNFPRLRKITVQQLVVFDNLSPPPSPTTAPAKRVEFLRAEFVSGMDASRLTVGRLEITPPRFDTFEAVDRFLGFVDACDEVAVDFARIYLTLNMDIVHCTDTEFASVTRVVDRIIDSFTDVVKHVSIKIDKDDLFKHAVDILPESVSSLTICAMPRKETIDAISALKRPLRVHFMYTLNMSKSLVQLAVDAEALVPGLKFNISGTEPESEPESESEEEPEEEPESESDDLM